jgi:hypothetical protein
MELSENRKKDHYIHLVIPEGGMGNYVCTRCIVCGREMKSDTVFAHTKCWTRLLFWEQWNICLKCDIMWKKNIRSFVSPPFMDKYRERTGLVKK